MAKAKRLYSLYKVTQKNGRKSYIRTSEMAFTLDTARRVFQTALLQFNGTVLELRPIKTGKEA